MKLATAVISFLLISGVASAQAAKTTPPPAPAAQTAPQAKPSTPVPQLTEEEKIQILSLQRNIAEATVNIAALQKQQSDQQNQLGTLAANIQRRLGPGFVVNRDTLVVTEVPPTPAPEAKK